MLLLKSAPCIQPNRPVEIIGRSYHERSDSKGKSYSRTIYNDLQERYVGFSEADVADAQREILKDCACDRCQSRREPERAPAMFASHRHRNSIDNGYAAVEKRAPRKMDYDRDNAPNRRWAMDLKVIHIFDPSSTRNNRKSQRCACVCVCVCVCVLTHRNKGAYVQRVRLAIVGFCWSSLTPFRGFGCASGYFATKKPVRSLHRL